MEPTSFHINHNDQNERFEVVKNGAVVQTYSSEEDAQTYIDIYRQAAARLGGETPEDLPLDELTDTERQILYPDSHNRG